MLSPEQTRVYIPRSVRARDLIAFTRTEISQFDAGEIVRISSNGELGNRFGYQGVNVISGLLGHAGLISERRRIRACRRKQVF